MSSDGHGTKCRRNIAENYNRLSRAHERYRQTDRQTDRYAEGRATAYSEREREFVFAKTFAKYLKSTFNPLLDSIVFRHYSGMFTSTTGFKIHFVVCMIKTASSVKAKTLS